MDDGLRITKDQLCVSDRVPSRGFCFPGKVAKKKKIAGCVFSNGAAAGIKIAKTRFSLAGHFQTAPLRQLVVRQLEN